MPGGVQRLAQHLLLPHVGVGVERIPRGVFDGGTLRGWCVGVVLGPLVGAQCVQHVGDGQGAVFQRNAGVSGLRAFLVGRQPHQPGERGGGGRAVIDGRDGRPVRPIRPAPPGAGTGQCGRVITAGKNALAHAAGAQPCVQVNPAQAAAALGVAAQHLAQGLVAPGWVLAAVKQALRVVVLATTHCCLPGRHTVLADVGRHRLLHGRGGRPGGGQQQVGDVVITRVARQWLRKILKVAVQVHVFMGGAAPP